MYAVHNADDKWNKTYPKKNVCVIYDVNNKSVYVENVDTIPIFSLMDKFSYIFSKQPDKQLKKAFKFMNNINMNGKQNVIKKCGFNGVNSELLTNYYNAVMSIMSLSQYEYPPQYLTQEVYIQGDYNEMLTVKDYQHVANSVVDEHCKQFKFKHFVDFISELQKNFPLNYGGSIRRFVNVIDKQTLKAKPSKNNYEYYIGYDCRTTDTNNEIKLAEHVEHNIYTSKDDNVYVYETYNNSISKIKEICKNNNLKYKDIHKHCIMVNSDDYNKLSTMLVATLSDFIC